MEYGLSIWDMVCPYGNLPFRYGHPGYRYRMWANDMGDDSIDMVISYIDVGYRVTLIDRRDPAMTSAAERRMALSNPARAAASELAAAAAAALPLLAATAPLPAAAAAAAALVPAVLPAVWPGTWPAVLPAVAGPGCSGASCN